ncbi:DegT/DnrJ/EryC1/StrS family aminotransferase [Sphingomonas sp. AR_OL41]|uniref:DegT/DnrJ/EryC1/StrS family aminotransferase n=1 Tax=Sphingomonas sp. AR_OL41 TaxID=3042729 RepID=UPI0024800C90|nr:DegT/DnrJ/EryC1/StrS family aminotransferase [Sphingomonas sp. AR_OL41]MDH7972904.1 DegT/DnrJ/EryC1/StrS family aminotransferase [Sphingomonas sp. AR_OL41]
MGEMISFATLERQRDLLRDRIDAAIARVLDHGQYIMGPEVAAFEIALAAFTQASHVVGCANGTDALTMVMMAEGIGPGDVVFVPAFSFVATAEAAAQLGATPYFVDVEEGSFNLDPASLGRAVEDAANGRFGRSRLVIPVDLFGQPADYTTIGSIAQAAGLTILSDAAQSVGGVADDRAVGTLAPWTTTSFFPSKPLGCYGDGGAVFCDTEEKAELLRSLRFHGKGSSKYDTVRVGLNSRLDTLQAAILIEKLTTLAPELERRQAIADRYSSALADIAEVPRVRAGARSAWAQYTLRIADRNAVAERCKAAGVPTAVYYPRPLHLLGGYEGYPVVPGGCPISERLCGEVLSLPMGGYLRDDEIDRVISVVRG